MILLPSSGGNVTRIPRTVNFLYYVFKNGVNETDYKDTINGLIRANDSIPASNYPETAKVITLIQRSALGFTVQYVSWKDANLAERTSQTLSSLRVDFIDAVNQVKDTASNLQWGATTFWDDFKTLFSQVETYVVIFAILILVLVIWRFLK